MGTPLAKVIQMVAVEMEEDGQTITYLYTLDGILVARLEIAPELPDEVTPEMEAAG